MTEDDTLIMFPPFVANLKDPVYFFNDEAFHDACFQTHPLANRALALRELFEAATANRLCHISQKPVSAPEGGIFIPLITSDENEELYKFDFMCFDRNNISNWNEREYFIETMNRFKAEDKWRDRPGYEFFDRFLKNLNEPVIRFGSHLTQAKEIQPGFSSG